MVQEQQTLSNEANIEQSETKFGIPVDYGFARPATEEQIQRTADSLRKRGFAVEIVDTPEDARALVNSTLPLDKTILTISSETVRLSGLGEDINGPNSKYKSLRQLLSGMNAQTQFREMVKLGATPDIAIGSVHAITEDGQVLVASASGSQLGPYSAGAEKVIWLVGSQKIVPDFSEGMRRLKMYSFPLEDIRMHEARNMGSSLAKVLVMNGERPGRVSLIIIRAPIGF
jgi:LUD domain